MLRCAGNLEFYGDYRSGCLGNGTWSGTAGCRECECLVVLDVFIVQGYYSFIPVLQKCSKAIQDIDVGVFDAIALYLPCFKSEQGPFAREVFTYVMRGAMLTVILFKHFLGLHHFDPTFMRHKTHYDIPARFMRQMFANSVASVDLCLG